MSEAPEHKIPWIKRPDLLIARYDSESWVIKDPLAMTYTYLDDLECRILRRLDGQCTFSQLLNYIRQVTLDTSLTAEELADFIRTLAGHRLIRQTFRSTTASRKNPAERRRVNWLAFLRPVMNLLRLRIRLLNPTALLDAVMPLVRRFVQPATGWLIVGLTGLAAALVVLRFSEVTNSLPDLSVFLGPGNLFLMLIIFVFVKAMHEAGHAITARYFNAECTECGIMMLMFTPVLYTNVSDAWTLTRKQRLCVTAAGIGVEIVIASVCTIAWWFALPGTMKAILLNTMVICSVNSLLFNGNPLLRFDGYFLLSDYLRIPNLNQQASTKLKDVFRRVFCSREASEISDQGHNHWLLLTYGILSLIYRVILTLVIVRLVHEVGHIWKQSTAAYFLNCLVVVAFIGVPVASVLSEQTLQVDSSSRRWNILRLSVLVGVVGLLCFVRLPHSVTGPAYVYPTGQHLYVQLPGDIKPSVSYGERVETGQVVAFLANAELERKKESLAGEVEQLQLQLNLMLEDTSSVDSGTIPAVRNHLATAQNRRDRFLSEYKQLQVSAERDGILLPPRYRSVPEKSSQPEEWSGYPLSTRNRDAYLDRGTLLGVIRDNQGVKVSAWISEDDIQYILPKQQVCFLSSCDGIASFTGTVEQISSVTADSVPLELGLAGLQNGHSTEEGIQPASPVHEVTIRLDQNAETPVLPVYSVGQVRIATNRVSLMHRWARMFRQTFSFRAGQ